MHRDRQPHVPPRLRGSGPPLPHPSPLRKAAVAAVEHTLESRITPRRGTDATPATLRPRGDLLRSATGQGGADGAASGESGLWAGVLSSNASGRSNEATNKYRVLNQADVRRGA